jgi:putative colanic acid biosynthesis glycosyltransferase WcaI
MSLHGTGAEDRGLRILVHDFAGHPFQIDLSRALARRGHEVLHVYCETYTSGKGRFTLGPEDTGLTIAALAAGDEFARYAPARRVAQELDYGRRFVARARGFRPDVVLACNVPLLAQTVAARWFRRAGVPWVLWLQDVYSVAAAAAAESRVGTLGRILGRGFEPLERSLARSASRVVPITDDFRPDLERWGIQPEHCTVVENWAPLDDLPPRPRDNAWRWNQGLGDRFVFLYSGTLGLKHRPELLFELAAQHVSDAEVVVISEGRGASRLRELFSVPSKVLSYMCAGRPILGAIPPENLAARTIERAGAGVVASPTDEEGFLLAAKQLRNELDRRESAGARARAYAEATFDTEAIADRFATVIDDALDRPRRQDLSLADAGVR